MMELMPHSFEMFPASGFTITSLADLFDGHGGCAFEFHDKSTLYQSEDNSSPVTASGQSANYVEDQSGNGLHLSTTFSGQEPTYIESGSVSYLSCSNDYFDMSFSTSALAFMHKDAGFGIAMLVSVGGTSNPDAEMILLTNCDNDVNKVGAALIYDDRSSLSRDNWLIFRSLNGAGSGATARVYSVFDTSGDITPQTAAQIIVNVPSGGDADLLLDGTVQNSSAKDNTEDTGDATSNLTIGAKNGGTSALTGELYALCIRDESFSSDELSAIGSYFGSLLA